MQTAAELFAQKGFRATTVREIADAAGILSGSLYHHFDSKESIGDEILSSFINDVLADYRAAAASDGSPRDVIEQIVRSTSQTLSRHRAALAMLQNDWSYFSTQSRFAYLRKALGEIEQTWIAQFERGKEAAAGCALDPLTVGGHGRVRHGGGGRRHSAAALRRDSQQRRDPLKLNSTTWSPPHDRGRLIKSVRKKARETFPRRRDPHGPSPMIILDAWRVSTTGN